MSTLAFVLFGSVLPFVAWLWVVITYPLRNKVVLAIVLSIVVAFLLSACGSGGILGDCVGANASFDKCGSHVPPTVTPTAMLQFGLFLHPFGRLTSKGKGKGCGGFIVALLFVLGLLVLAYMGMQSIPSADLPCADTVCQAALDANNVPWGEMLSK